MEKVLDLAGSPELLGTAAGVAAGKYLSLVVTGYVPGLRSKPWLVRAGLLAGGLWLAVVGGDREPWLRDVGFGLAAVEVVGLVQEKLGGVL